MLPSASGPGGSAHNLLACLRSCCRGSAGTSHFCVSPLAQCSPSAPQACPDSSPCVSAVKKRNASLCIGALWVLATPACLPICPAAWAWLCPLNSVPSSRHGARPQPLKPHLIAHLSSQLSRDAMLPSASGLWGSGHTCLTACLPSTTLGCALSILCLPPGMVLALSPSSLIRQPTLILNE